MSGVYIKGMEMPECCWMCFARTDVNIGVGIADGCNLLKEMISNPNERLPDCPLIPAPSHGRLIDADALLDDLLFPSKQFEQGMRELLGDAPTIIPAEDADYG